MVRIGVLGCANIAERMVIPAIKNLKSEFKLVAISSRSEQKAFDFASKFDALPILGYDNLIDRTDIDAIYMPLPTGIHHEWILKSFQTGKHVICEKSLGLNFTSTQELVETAKLKNLSLMENFMFKYHNQHKIVWEHLQNNHIGDIKLFRSQFCFPPLQKDNFRYDPGLGGGSLLDAGAYTVMASRWFLGNDQEVISSVLYDEPKKGTNIYGNVSLLSKKGIVSQLSFGFDNYYQCNYDIHGSLGRLFLEKAFTPKPEEPTKVLLETNLNKTSVLVNPDNHFQNILSEFRRSIIKCDNQKHYDDILDQSNTLTKIYDSSIKIQL